MSRARAVALALRATLETQRLVVASGDQEFIEAGWNALERLVEKLLAELPAEGKS